MSDYDFYRDAGDAHYEVYEDGVYIGDYYPKGYGGGEFSFRQMFMTLVPISIEVIFTLMCIICPIVFFAFILPDHSFIDAILEGAHLVALWIMSVIVTLLMIKRKIFIHNINTSSDDRYVAIRRAIMEEKSGVRKGTSISEGDKSTFEDEDKIYLKEISSPLGRALSRFRIVLLSIVAILMIGRLSFPALPFAEGMMVIIMPMFAYGYILSFVGGYIQYGKLANFFILAFFVATLIASFLMGCEPLDTVGEYIMIIALFGTHEITEKIIQKKLEE